VLKTEICSELLVIVIRIFKEVGESWRQLVKELKQAAVFYFRLIQGKMLKVQGKWVFMAQNEIHATV
jgi:RNase P/RNase MRP subunit p29